MDVNKNMQTFKNYSKVCKFATKEDDLVQSIKDLGDEVVGKSTSADKI